MIEQAKTKINAEMTANQANGFVQVVGAFLLQHLQSNPGDAGKIMTDGKTILKSLDDMRKVAEKKKVGNCGVIDPQEGYSIVLKHFGIDGTAPAVFVPAPRETITVTSGPTKPAKASDFNVSLDDFLK
jgi:hypothetical protein